MENKRKIVAYKQPFDIKGCGLKKGEKWVKCKGNESFYINKNGMLLYAEIVESCFEPEYKQIKLEDLPQVEWEELYDKIRNSPLMTADDYIKEIYPNGVIIKPLNK